MLVVVVVERRDVVIDEVRDDDGAQGGPRGPVGEHCLEPVVNEVHHCHKHRRGEILGGHCATGAADSALEEGYGWCAQELGQVGQHASGGGVLRTREICSE